ncbi:HRDC domain-containing protein [Dermacoccaceae bacterium W4C1]
MSRRATAAAGPPERNAAAAQQQTSEDQVTEQQSTQQPASTAAQQPDPTPEQEPLPLLEAPAEGIPPVIESERDLLAAARTLAAGSGPVALDAERASGYRYSNRAYLVQIRRSGAGSFLIDPIACPDLSPIQEAIGEAEWVLHAATQDLPCLAEVGLHPSALFDTELGSRLAGLPRVGLGAVVEHYLGVSLAKEHSAADWSTRPLPEPWLRYAALDVEVLVEVRDALAADLRSQGKEELAAQEFAALVSFTGPPPRTDPWRRTSSMHKVRNRRAVARVRELWLARDAIAQERDLSPGRVLPDALIVQVAGADPRTEDDLLAAVGTSSGRRNKPPHRSVQRYKRQWLQAVRTADDLPERELPASSVRTDAPPPPRAWADRDPVAAARLTQVRDALAEHSASSGIPVENLLTPDSLRRVLWRPPKRPDAENFSAALAEFGARPWQIELVVPLLVRAVADHPVEPVTGE